MDTILTPLVVLASCLLLLWPAGAYTLARSPAAAWTAIAFGVLATMASVVLQMPILPLLRGTGDGPMTAFILAFGAAGLVEEGLKLAGSLVTALIFRKRLAADPGVAVRIAAAAGLGFATVENMLYGFSTAYLADGRTFALIALRLVTALPMHLTAALLMGVFLMRYLCPETRGRGWLGDGRRRFWPALAVPALLHGTYNFPQMLVRLSASDVPVLDSPADLAVIAVMALMIYAALYVALGPMEGWKAITGRLAHRRDALPT